jgi:hypothetical protein
MAARILSSYVSEKCHKGGRSTIEGGGQHAIASISGGEVVAAQGWPHHRQRHPPV